MHTKRLAVGKGKGIKWVITPRGPHSKNMSLTLTEVLKKLGFADTTSEAKKIISNGEVAVDGKKVKDHKYGVGFMDTLEIPSLKKHYIISTDKHRLTVNETKKSDVKLCKVIGKRLLPGGKTQVSLHDGGNILYDKPVKVGDTAVVEIPKRKIKQVIPFDVGSHVIIVSGRHQGQKGQVTELLTSTATRESITAVGQTKTLTEYVFVTGLDKPMID